MLASAFNNPGEPAVIEPEAAKIHPALLERVGPAKPPGIYQTSAVAEPALFIEK